MGDIFEYLLSELNTAGKNGQFRTPRHIIRFMIELIDPEPGKRVFDPAAGTGGFLTNTILHHWMKKTPPSQLRLEWDGTPHRLIGRENLGSDDEIFNGANVSGFDIDRTMVRIGWMNLILHSVDNPQFRQTDPLSQSFIEPSNSYDYAFANPPYSGTVDRHDLNLTRFPRKTPNSSEPITDRTELLFLWLMLDLLKPGGRMAVIVPEGLLFGSTGAHKALRRELLFQHEVEGVVSLPQGVFQPYTGVKTSILVVKKGEARTDVGDPTAEPRTKQVWFYEILRDGFALGANRTPQPEQRNDLWDALEKWKRRNDMTTEQKPTDYWQPEIHRERWRQVDKLLTELFPTTVTKTGDVLAIQEIFPDLSSTPDFSLKTAEESAVATAEKDLYPLLLRTLSQQSFAKKAGFQLTDLTDAQREQAINSLRAFLRQSNVLEKREGAGSQAEEHGRGLLSQAIDRLRLQAESEPAAISTEDWEAVRKSPNISPTEAQDVLKPLARLDGFDIFLRSADTILSPEPLTVPQCWTIPVRAWRVQSDWVPQTIEGQTTMVEPGSHDAQGNVRPEYVAAALDSKTKQIRLEFLVTDCIEASDSNLSAGRYRPTAALTAVQNVASTAEQIRELLVMEQNIQANLERLLAMVEGTS